MTFEIIGTIQKAYQSRFIWSFQNIKNFQGGFYDSPEFEYDGKTWAIYMNHSWRHVFLLFFLKLKKAVPVFDISYKLFIKDHKKKTVWESPIVLDTFCKDGYFYGIPSCHRKRFILDLMALNEDCLSLYIEFEPPEISYAAILGQKFLCASLKRLQTLDEEPLKEEDTDEESDLETGGIDNSSKSTFTWMLPNADKLLSKPLCSPTFEYRERMWTCNFYLGNVKPCYFYLLLNSESEEIDIPYKMSIKDHKNIFWESPIILDTFSDDEKREGIWLSLKKDFISDVINSNSNYLFLHIEFNPPEIHSSSATRRQKMVCASLASFQLVDALKTEYADKEKKKEYLKEFKILARDYKSLQQGGDRSDFLLKVGEKEFKVHMAVLMARSPVFKRMLQHDVVENRDGVLRISDSDPKTVKKLLWYIYTGMLPNVTEHNVVALHDIADLYDLPSLVEHCRSEMIDFLSKNVFCDYYSVFVKHADADCISECKTFFKENFRSILRTEKWSRFLAENVIQAQELLLVL